MAVCKSFDSKKQTKLTQLGELNRVLTKIICIIEMKKGESS